MDRGDPLSLFLLPTWKRPDLDRGEGEWEWQWAGKFMKHSQKDVSVRCSVDPSGDGRPGVDCRWQQSGNSARKGGSLLSLEFRGFFGGLRLPLTKKCIDLLFLAFLWWVGSFAFLEYGEKKDTHCLMRIGSDVFVSYSISRHLRREATCLWAHLSFYLWIWHDPNAIITLFGESSTRICWNRTNVLLCWFVSSRIFVLWIYIF